MDTIGTHLIKDGRYSGPRRRQAASVAEDRPSRGPKASQRRVSARMWMRTSMLPPGGSKDRGSQGCLSLECSAYQGLHAMTRQGRGLSPQPPANKPLPTLNAIRSPAQEAEQGGSEHPKFITTLSEAALRGSRAGVQSFCRTGCWFPKSDESREYQPSTGCRGV